MSGRGTSGSSNPIPGFQHIFMILGFERKGRFDGIGTGGGLDVGQLPLALPDRVCVGINPTTGPSLLRPDGSTNDLSSGVTPAEGARR